MIFKRRERPPFWSRVRDFAWPRRGWRRSLLYMGWRVRRLSGTPHSIALGFSCGVFASFTPFFGLHFFIAWLCAFVTRGNPLASLMGTFFGNPLTFPFIAVTSMTTGGALLGRGATQAFRVDEIFEAFAGFFRVLWGWMAFWREDHTSLHRVAHRLDHLFDTVMLPYLVGGLGPGLLCATGFYLVSRPLIAAYQQRRREKMKRQQKQ